MDLYLTFWWILLLLLFNIIHLYRLSKKKKKKILKHLNNAFIIIILNKWYVLKGSHAFFYRVIHEICENFPQLSYSIQEVKPIYIVGSDITVNLKSLRALYKATSSIKKNQFLKYLKWNLWPTVKISNLFKGSRNTQTFKIF